MPFSKGSFQREAATYKPVNTLQYNEFVKSGIDFKREQSGGKSPPVMGCVWKGGLNGWLLWEDDTFIFVNNTAGKPYIA